MLFDKYELKEYQNIKYGSIASYSVVVDTKDIGNHIKIGAVFQDDSQKCIVDTALKDTMATGQYDIKSFSIEKQGIIVSFSRMKNAEQFLDWFLDFLKQEDNQVHGESHCWYCGAEFSEQPSYLESISGFVVPMHRHCVSAFRQSLSKKTHELEPDPIGITIRGIIGAFLGALVGILPWVIITVFIQSKFASLGFIVVGILSKIGYQWAGGKKGLTQLWTLIGVAIPAVLLGHYMSACLNLGYQVWLGNLSEMTYSQIPAVVIQSMNSFNVWLDAAGNYLFTLIMMLSASQSSLQKAYQDYRAHRLWADDVLYYEELRQDEDALKKSKKTLVE